MKEKSKTNNATHKSMQSIKNKITIKFTIFPIYESR